MGQSPGTYSRKARKGCGRPKVTAPREFLGLTIYFKSVAVPWQPEELNGILFSNRSRGAAAIGHEHRHGPLIPKEENSAQDRCDRADGREGKTRLCDRA